MRIDPAAFPRPLLATLPVYLFVAALAAPALAQTPSIPGVGSQSLSPAAAQQLQSDPKFQQWLSFYQPRAYPFASIPAGAYQAAHQEFIAKWGTAPGSESAARSVPGQPPALNQWTSIGPTPIGTGASAVAGRVNTIAINPSSTNIMYIGAADGGVWKTTDGGNTWTSMTDGQCSLAMGALAIDPVNTNIVYAGTGEQNFSLDSYYGCGVLRSADGGQTWTQLGASTFVTASGGATISRVLIDPTTAGSTTNTTLLLTSSFGIYRSTNSGSNWTQVLAGVATDIVRDPTTPTTLYAALGNIFGNPSNGVYKSTDGGQTWSPLSGGFPSSNTGRINLAIAPSSPSTLYAAVQNQATFGLLGVWKSTNSGAAWTQLSATNLTCTFGGSAQCWYDLYVYVDPTNANTVYIGTQDVFKSTDGGNTFSDMGGYTGGIHPDQHNLAFMPGNPSTILVVNDGGVYKSQNGGSTWSTLNQTLTITQFEPGLSTTPNGSQVFGGTQDNGSNLYTGSTIWTNVAGGDGAFTAIDYNTPTVAYHEYTGISIERTTNFGTSPSWTPITTGILSNNTAFYIPFVMSPTNSQTLYLGTDYLNKTTNQGSSWTQIGIPGTAGFNTTDQTISAIAQAKSNAQVIYVGMSSGDMQATANGGTSWTDIKAGLPNRALTYIAVNPANAQNAFVTFSGFGTGHVFATTNSGASWSDISGNLPNIPVNTIMLNPAAPSTDIFVGTDLGVFRTTNGGAAWNPYQTGLPNVVVYDLVYNAATGTVFAATHGRSVWKATITGNPAAHDFNGDGKSDIAWRDSSGNGAIWLMNGTQILQTGSLGNVANSWSMIGQRDFDGNGTADLLWRDSSGNLGLWFMNGVSIAGTASVGSVPTNWSVYGTGDLNGDGKGDLLWQDSMTGNVAVWFMNGSSIASTAGLGNPGGTWKIVGDDNRGDIFWRDGSGNLAIWKVNGSQITGAASLGNVPTNWVIAGLGDFNGDGVTDLLWRDTTSGAVAIWFLNSAMGIQSTTSLGIVGATWSIALTGDYNGDGTSDILWIDNTGSLAAWFISGGAISSTTGYGNVGTSWSVQARNAE